MYSAGPQDPVPFLYLQSIDKQCQLSSSEYLGQRRAVTGGGRKPSGHLWPSTSQTTGVLLEQALWEDVKMLYLLPDF
jgi:hypothetical protein